MKEFINTWLAPTISGIIAGIFVVEYSARKQSKPEEKKMNRSSILKIILAISGILSVGFLVQDDIRSKLLIKSQKSDLKNEIAKMTISNDLKIKQLKDSLNKISQNQYTKIRESIKVNKNDQNYIDSIIYKLNWGLTQDLICGMATMFASPGHSYESDLAHAPWMNPLIQEGLIVAKVMGTGKTWIVSFKPSVAKVLETKKFEHYFDKCFDPNYIMSK